MAKQEEFRKFVPKLGASGMTPVSFDEHEQRGSSSPSEKMAGPRNTVAVLASDPKRKGS